MAIELEGTAIDDLPLDEIVRRAAKPEHVIYPGGDRMDYYRNRDLLKLFDGGGVFESDEFLAAEGVAERLLMFPDGRYSKQFNVLRLGELINWGCRHGIVQRCPNDIWRILAREPQFEMCGPERHQVAVRVRGLSGEAAVAATKIWQRELKRRERARVKRIGLLVDHLHRDVDTISRHAPETKLPEALARFAVGEHDTIVAVRELIADALLPMSVPEADAIVGAVHAVYLPIAEAVAGREAEVRRIRREEARQREEAELAALAAMFPQPPPPPPPPPPEPFPAEVRTRHVPGGYMGSTYIEVEGALEDVQRTMGRIEEEWFDGLNPVHFKTPEQIAKGRWLAHGRKDRGTD